MPPAAAAPPDLRDKILDASLHVLRTGGIRRFTQTRVAQRAKIRQSHLTYYYPTKAALLEAAAERVLDGVTGHIAEVGRTVPGWGTGHLLGEIARMMCDSAHMRMFLAIIVEADRDPAVRKLLQGGSTRVHAAITEALGGGPTAARRARVLQVAIWGLGFFTFANPSIPTTDLTNDTLDLLEEFAR